MVADRERKAARPTGARHPLHNSGGSARVADPWLTHPVVVQALRLGTFLNETKPIKALHKSVREGQEKDAVPSNPLVLRLGNYLNGDKAAEYSGDSAAAAPLRATLAAEVQAPDAPPAVPTAEPAESASVEPTAAVATEPPLA